MNKLFKRFYSNCVEVKGLEPYLIPITLPKYFSLFSRTEKSKVLTLKLSVMKKSVISFLNSIVLVQWRKPALLLP